MPFNYRYKKVNLNPDSVAIDRVYSADYTKVMRWYVTRVVVESRHKNPDTEDPVISFDPNDSEVVV